MSDNRRKMEMLRKFIDGELSPNEEAEALRQMADDTEMRKMLRFERSLFYTLRRDDSEYIDVPDHFADNVMQKIEEMKTPGTSVNLSTEEAGMTDRIKRILGGVLEPRRVTMRPAWIAMAAIFVITAIFFLPEVQTIEQAPVAQTDDIRSPQLVAYEEETVWVRFVFFDDEAEHVSVAGDFSDWEPVELNREMSGDRLIWTGMIQATRGEQRYMFIKNGEEWVTDPFADVQRDDGFGNKNAVIYL
jgi:hypothetical protein